MTDARSSANVARAARPEGARAESASPEADFADVLSAAATVADRCAEQAAEADAHGAFPEEEFGLLREAGLLRAPLPAVHGGRGLGRAPGTAHALLRLLFEIGRGSLPVGRVFEGHANALALIHLYSTPEQQARAAADVRQGRLFGVWNTEVPSSGVHLEPLPGGRYRLRGAKTFCSGAGHVARPFVSGALPGGGWQLCVVPMDRADVQAHVEVDPSWWRAEGMRASASYRVDFTGAELDADDLVGAPGDYLREPHFNGGAVRFAAVQLGGAQALFDAARQHLRTLERTGDVHQQTRMGRAAIHLETGALWLLGAARMQERLLLADGAPLRGAFPERGPEQEKAAEALVAYARMTRTAIEEACLEVLRGVDRSVGARGLLPPSPVERIGRDLRLYLRQPAADAVLEAAGAYALGADERPLGSSVAVPPRS